MQAIVCGLGSMGRRRIRILNRKFPDIRICAVDTDRKKLDSVNQETNSAHYDFFKAFRDFRPDIVFICTPPATHSGLAAFALENKAHVFSELNLVSDGYDEIQRAAKANSRVAFLSSTFLYHREIRWIIENVHNCGPLSYRYHTGQYLPDWHPWEDYRSFFVAKKETSALREIMAIEFPWIFKAFGGVVDYRCMAHTLSELELDYPDSVHLIVKHESGHAGSISFDCVSAKPVRQLEVYNDKNFIEWKGAPGTLTRYLNDKKETCPVKLYQDIIDDAQFAEFIFDNPYEQEMHDFFEMIKNPALAPAHDYEKDKIIIDFIDRIENSL